MNYFGDGCKDQCLLDSGTTHTILKSKEYFSELKLFEKMLTQYREQPN